MGVETSKSARKKRTATNLYLYNGNELQSDFGLNTYDFNYRMYDPAIGRFWQIDPLADQGNQVDKSPFAFSWNNPVLLNDPSGLSPDNEYEVKTNADGTTTTTQTGTAGGDVTDHITYVDADGNKTTKTVDVETVNIPAIGPNIREPGVNMVSSPASGAVETMDGEDDPIFSLISSWLTGGFKLASGGGNLLEDGVLAFAKRKGRSGKQKVLKEMAEDSKLSKSILGWFKNEFRRITSGNGGRGLRLPFNGRKSPGRKRADKGYELAHPADKPAAHGNGYSGSKLKLHADHKVETKLARKKGRY